MTIDHDRAAELARDIVAAADAVAADDPLDRHEQGVVNMARWALDLASRVERMERALLKEATDSCDPVTRQICKVGYEQATGRKLP